MAANPVIAEAPPAKAAGKKKSTSSKSAGGTLDLATIGGLLLAVGGMLTGLLAEGGKIQDVSQITAAMIVFPGTLGAVMVTTPVDVLLRAFRRLPQIFFHPASGTAGLLEQ